MTLTLPDLSRPLAAKPSTMTSETFLATYGGIYEHSPWVAEAAWAARKGTELDRAEGLFAAMRSAVDLADRAAQMTLICAHPDLAGKVGLAADLTDHSRREQQGAGLDRCTAEEYEAFQSLNTAYKERFGFPFIIAVKGHDRASILDAFRSRVTHDAETEFKTAIEQIHRIAAFRLEALTE
ncbi:2-oxo-4-hydroxy-4-carboxy-5-ureidoimidazoline decarboxylase [Yunchengibacter salinarum]|uniref:2-oxo-4-hydroxy-4-carboxy-5-ureidoimidazoline decarboxylase n=1 Tax=Yunchengibacter salinarum TaxID=3133399 RepID=UPI0035B68E12